jgi:hypothetical protein
MLFLELFLRMTHAASLSFVLENWVTASISPSMSPNEDWSVGSMILIFNWIPRGPPFYSSEWHFQGLTTFQNLYLINRHSVPEDHLFIWSPSLCLARVPVPHVGMRCHWRMWVRIFVQRSISSFWSGEETNKLEASVGGNSLVARGWEGVALLEQKKIAAPSEVGWCRGSRMEGGPGQPTANGMTLQNLLNLMG